MKLNIRPSADLRNRYNEISKQCRETREAVIITVTSFAKVPGTTRLLSKLANEIKKDPNGEIQRGSFFMHKTKNSM